MYNRYIPDSEGRYTRIPQEEFHTAPPPPPTKPQAPVPLPGKGLLDKLLGYLKLEQVDKGDILLLLLLLFLFQESEDEELLIALGLLLIL